MDTMIQTQREVNSKLIKQSKALETELNNKTLEEMKDLSILLIEENVMLAGRDIELTGDKNHLEQELRDYENLMQNFTKQQDLMQEEMKRYLKIHKEKKNEFSNYQTSIPKLEMLHNSNLQEIEGIVNSTNSEMIKIEEEESELISDLEMKEKILQLQIPALRASLEQKTAGNIELTKVCEKCLTNSQNG